MRSSGLLSPALSGGPFLGAQSQNRYTITQGGSPAPLFQLVIEPIIPSGVPYTKAPSSSKLHPGSLSKHSQQLHNFYAFILPASCQKSRHGRTLEISLQAARSAPVGHVLHALPLNQLKRLKMIQNALRSLPGTERRSCFPSFSPGRSAG